MYYSASILAFFLASMAPTSLSALSSEGIKEAVGTGCVNSVKFHSSFLSDTGNICSECAFCDGSRLNSLLDPKVESVCIDCGAAENNCKSIEILTEFENPWMMNFVTLTSSAKSSDEDPSKITIKALDDSSTWKALYDSEVKFEGRNQLILFNNHKQYNKYSITYERKISSALMSLGHYGLIEAYTKGCAANIYGNITKDNVLPYETLAPTESPTVEPTQAPTSTPFDTSTLNNAVSVWNYNRQIAIDTWGHIKYWSTGRVTSMKDLFRGASSFNDDISLWNTASVSDMSFMFRDATEFNSDLSQWNTGAVGNMNNMFNYASNFTSDLSQWNTGSVTTMGSTFGSASTFNSDLSQWNIGSVTNMYYMFGDASSFTYDLCWDLDTVPNTKSMFLRSPGSSTDC